MWFINSNYITRQSFSYIVFVLRPQNENVLPLNSWWNPTCCITWPCFFISDMVSFEYWFLYFVFAVSNLFLRWLFFIGIFSTRGNQLLSLVGPIISCRNSQLHLLNNTKNIRSKTVPGFLVLKGQTPPIFWFCRTQNWVSQIANLASLVHRSYIPVTRTILNFFQPW